MTRTQAGRALAFTLREQRRVFVPLPAYFRWCACGRSSLFQVDLHHVQRWHDGVQAGHFISGDGGRGIGHAVRVEPATGDAIAVGAQDVGIEPVADDDGRVLAECAGHVGRVFEEAHVRLGVAARFRGGDEGNVVAQAGGGDAAVLNGFDAVGDDAHFADGRQGRAHLPGAVDQHHRVGQGLQVQAAGQFRVQVDGVFLEGLAEAFHFQEVLAHRAQLETFPQVDVDFLVAREQGINAVAQAQGVHGVQKRAFFGRPEVEQGIVQVKQEQVVLHGMS